MWLVLVLIIFLKQVLPWHDTPFWKAYFTGIPYLKLIELLYFNCFKYIDKKLIAINTVNIKL